MTDVDSTASDSRLTPAQARRADKKLLHQARAKERAPRTRPSTGDVVRALVRGIGQTLITAGVVLLLFVVYTLYITNLFTAADQRQLNDDLAQTWAQATVTRTDTPASPSAPAATPSLGSAFARIYIPRIGVGMDDPLAVVQGVSVADLKKGPGHLPQSALPGQVGNLVISGHRTTYGAPFNKLDQVRVGDEIIVETATSYYTYRMTTQEVVKPSEFEVTYPVPRQFGATPTKRIITLTTCNPKYSAKQRLILHGELFTAVEKPAQPPALERG